MKAISLYQPWASAMASGVKQIETRSWPTGYRGDLVICSAKRSLDQVGLSVARDNNISMMAMKFGFALCVVELYDCVPTQEFHRAVPMKVTQTEADLGDYTPGRFAWLTRNVRRIRPVVPVTGHQGFWNLSSETVALINANLPND